MSSKKTEGQQEASTKENEKLLDTCAATYEALEDCLADSNRDWRKCQEPLKTWKDCFEQAKAAGMS